MKFNWLVGILVLICIWGIFSAFGMVSPLLLPSPWSVIKATIVHFADGIFLRDMSWSVYRLAVGFILGAAAGIMIGVIFGLSSRLYSYSELVLDFFRSLPVITVFPLFMILFGLGNAAKIATTMWAVFLIITVSTVYGIRQVPKTRVLSARTLGARGLFLITHVILPSAIPSVVSGFRIAVSLGLVVVVITEMFTGTDYGLGKRIYDSGLVYEMPTMYGAILVTGFLGYLLNRLIVSGEHAFAYWSGD